MVLSFSGLRKRIEQWKGKVLSMVLWLFFCSGGGGMKFTTPSTEIPHPQKGETEIAPFQWEIPI